MTFEEDDRVVLHDQHSEYDGQEGRVTQVMETMFGDANYTVSFEDGQEQGVPEDALEAGENESGEGANDASEGANDAGEGANDAAAARDDTESQ